MPTLARPIIVAASLRSKLANIHKNVITMYEPITDGSSCDKKSILKARRPIMPPQKKLTRTKIANASRVWSVGFGDGNEKKAMNARPEATPARKPPAKKPTASLSNGRLAFMPLFYQHLADFNSRETRFPGGNWFSAPEISISGLRIANSGVGNGVSEGEISDSGVGFINSEGGISVSGQEIADSGQGFVVS
jgi:hypothetical protein